VGHVAHMGEMRKAYKILVRESEMNVLPVRPRHRWKDKKKNWILRERKCGLDPNSSG